MGDLEGFVRKLADQPCEASAFYEIPEDGVPRCLDPEYNEMRDEDGNEITGSDLVRCVPCEARDLLSATDAPKRSSLQ